MPAGWLGLRRDVEFRIQRIRVGYWPGIGQRQWLAGQPLPEEPGPARIGPRWFAPHPSLDEARVHLREGRREHAQVQGFVLQGEPQMPKDAVFAEVG